MRRVLGVPGSIWLVMCFALAGSSVTLSEPGFILFDHNHIPAAAQNVLEHADQFELFSLTDIVFCNKPRSRAWRPAGGSFRRSNEACTRTKARWPPASIRDTVFEQFEKTRQRNS